MGVRKRKELKVLKRKKDKKRQWQEEREEECKGQVLNGDGESMRERVTCVRKIISARLQLCGRVGETKF